MSNIQETCDVTQENISKTKEKKLSSKTIIIGITAISILLIGLIVFFTTSNTRNYKKALELYNSDDYESAYTIFIELDNYKNSNVFAKICNIYLETNKLIDSGKYEEAISLVKDNNEILGEDRFKEKLDEFKYLYAVKLIEEHRFVDAYDNLVDNTYSKSATLIEEIESQYNSEKAVDDVLEYYQNMSDYLDKAYDADYSTTSLLSATGVDWDMYYKNRGASITNLIKDLNEQPYENCSDDIIDIIGYVPETKKECNKILSDLKEVFITDGGFKDYNGYFLYYVMTFITDDDEYILINRNDTDATITFTQTDKFLESKNISAKTFAYMLGVPRMYAMDIQKENECLILTFQKFSHNYSYCFIGNDEKKDTEIETFSNKRIDNMEYQYSKDGYDYFEIDLSGIKKYDLDYFRFAIVGTETKDDSIILSQDHHYLDNDKLNKSKVKLTVKIDSDSEYYCSYFVGDYS